MNITFRTDSSTQIGTGHAMRCLTLAKALKEQGANCQFICCEHEGHIIEHIEQQGFKTHRLLTTQQDAESTICILKEHKTNWLVVDHYGLDTSWESAVKPYVQKLMAIDDLANRSHNCDVLLDQNLGHKKEDYATLVPSHCQLLIGPNYALLRPEFTKWRETSLKRRVQPQSNNILITLGGVDEHNHTAAILTELKQTSLPSGTQLTVILGAANPHIHQVKQIASQMPVQTTVLIGVNNMAELMANSDLAISAAGSTVWELCALGVPSLLLCTASNQKEVIQALIKENAMLPWGLEQLTQIQSNLTYYSNLVAQITDGRGVERVVSYLR